MRAGVETDRADDGGAAEERHRHCVDRRQKGAEA